MNKIGYLTATAATFLLPLAASAQLTSSGTGKFDDIFSNLTTFINGTLVPFVMALAFLAFVWGMFRYFIAGGADEQKREDGKSLMIYATLGFVMIIVVWGIVNVISSSLFTSDELNAPGVKLPDGNSVGGAGSL